MFNRIGCCFLISIAFSTVAGAQTAYTPMTAADRLHWLVNRNLSTTALLEDIAAGAEGTRVKSYKEYGTHWEGFGKRVGMIAANDGVRSVMEAGLGSMWGERSPLHPHGRWNVWQPNRPRFRDDILRAKPRRRYGTGLRAAYRTDRLAAAFLQIHGCRTAKRRSATQRCRRVGGFS